MRKMPAGRKKVQNSGVYGIKNLRCTFLIRYTAAPNDISKVPPGFHGTGLREQAAGPPAPAPTAPADFWQLPSTRTNYVCLQRFASSERPAQEPVTEDHALGDPEGSDALWHYSKRCSRRQTLPRWPDALPEYLFGGRTP